TRSTTRPAVRPATRATLVAPGLPDPSAVGSWPWRRPTSNPVGKVPRRYDGTTSSAHGSTAASYGPRLWPGTSRRYAGTLDARVLTGPPEDLDAHLPVPLPRLRRRARGRAVLHGQAQDQVPGVQGQPAQGVRRPRQQLQGQRVLQERQPWLVLARHGLELVERHQGRDQERVVDGLGSVGQEGRHEGHEEGHQGRRRLRDLITAGRVGCRP